MAKCNVDRFLQVATFRTRCGILDDRFHAIWQECCTGARLSAVAVVFSITKSEREKGSMKNVDSQDLSEYSRDKTLRFDIQPIIPLTQPYSGRPVMKATHK